MKRERRTRKSNNTHIPRIVRRLDLWSISIRNHDLVFHVAIGLSTKNATNSALCSHFSLSRRTRKVAGDLNTKFSEVIGIETMNNALDFGDDHDKCPPSGSAFETRHVLKLFAEIRAPRCTITLAEILLAPGLDLVRAAL